MISGIDLEASHPELHRQRRVRSRRAGAADNVLALIHLQDASGLAGTHGMPNGLRLKFDDIFAAPVRTPQINQALGGKFKVSDWSIENASYFRAVRIEKTMMTLILMLIVAVAAFNIVAALVMVVNEKRTDIAILRTVGMTPRAVVGVFMTQGVLIGWFGALLGLIVGLLLAFNVGTIVPFLEGLVRREGVRSDCVRDLRYARRRCSGRRSSASRSLRWCSPCAGDDLSVRCGVRPPSLRKRCAMSKALRIPDRPPLSALEPGQPVRVFHLDHFDARHRHRRGGAHRRAVGDERLRA